MKRRAILKCPSGTKGDASALLCAGGRWLLAENEEFHGHSAADLIRRGEAGQLWHSLFYLRTGMPD